MNLSPEDKQVGKENFFAAIGSKQVKRTRGKGTSRDFLLEQIKKGYSSRKGMGAYYFGYESKVKEPLRVGVIGTGDEGNVLLGAINPEFVAVKAIADIRPFGIYRALHGEAGVAVRPGLLSVYGWKTEAEALKNLKIYRQGWQELLENAKADHLEAVIIALPLFLHAPVAIAAMKKGLHVLTEKLMGQTVVQCKEMARVAQETKLLLATGHQRHYSILYDNAVELVRNGVLGDLHYISAQWHRNNQPFPKKDTWKMPLPPGAKSDKDEPDVLEKELHEMIAQREKAAKDKKSTEVDALSLRIQLKEKQIEDKTVDAERHGYQANHWTYKDNSGNEVSYNRPAIEELIRWRLWDRTGAGLMAELGSHQLDAASIFISAMHGPDKHVHPLSVSASGTRPIFPQDRDIEDHVFCIFEFPHPQYDAKDEQGKKKKIGVQYSSINGNGFGGYGETVYGTEGTLILEREQEGMLYKIAATDKKTKVVAQKDKDGKPTGRASLVMDETGKGDEQSAAIGHLALIQGHRNNGDELERGYSEEIEHWAWCIRNPAPDHLPKCHPKVAMGDAVIALTANISARHGKRIEFNEQWFEPENDATPERDVLGENVKPDISKYKS